MVRPFRASDAWRCMLFMACAAFAVRASADDGSAAPRCEVSCSGLVAENVPAHPLTLDRAMGESGGRRSAYVQYIAASERAQAQDRAVLRGERAGLPSLPAARRPDARGIDALALDRPDASFGDARSLEVARTIASYQIPSGGWGKNGRYDGGPRRVGESWIADEVDAGGRWHFVGTLDNGASIAEIGFLARVQRVQSTDRARFRASAIRGIRWLLDAQYPDGGWPQIYPLAGGYADAVTLNDDAMLGAIALLDRIARERDGDYAFVDPALRRRCAASAQRGIDWLLSHQVTIAGQRTLWAQQYDALDGRPTAARAFEMPALATYESMNLLLFMMRQPEPSPRMRAAIRDGVRFVMATRMPGWRWENGRLLPSADGALWARFYALDRYAPDEADPVARATALFGDRPEPHRSAAYGLVFTAVDAVSEERRRGYAQYNRRGDAVIAAWQAWSSTGPGSR